VLTVSGAIAISIAALVICVGPDADVACASGATLSTIEVTNNTSFNDEHSR